MKIKLIALAVSAMTMSGAWAHGYLMDPPSRAYQCKVGNNQQCGNVTWEPQSVEQKSGFPDSALPRDGELASAGIPGFSQLNRQSADAWAKTSIKAGKQAFTWHHTAPHKTTNWRYYITKQDWNPNAPLTRDAFEKRPFCVIDGNGQAPAVEASHECNVPARTGYQAIYSVWEIADTANSFYQVADVLFDGKNTTPVNPSDTWTNVLDGQIYGKDLRAGDKVKLRFFSPNAETLSFATTLTITDELTDKNRWAKALAAAVNEKGKPWGLRAGMKDAQGNVEPVFGANRIYIASTSPAATRELKTIAISYEEATTSVSEQIDVSNLTSTAVKNGVSTLSFDLWTAGKVSVEAKVYDPIGTVKGYTKLTVTNADQRVSFDLEGVSAKEPYMLSIIATNDKGEPIQPEPQLVTLHAAAAEAETPATGVVKYDEIFPNNKSDYKSGTRVLQTKNGKVYQCKPFPYSGYCSQWSVHATQFEPGIGTSWQLAWIEE
ncbi:N-acetylglucosamine-binding protein GbpA [Mixta theicola]|uniref:N-acetylglucosamine-binding protein GbpA n=1 Tax=Mixta theicola TaxID=1458355 RepID=A0A2K1Q8A7_9GAMM|nr:N-acetylglucosamine-binding protein GbpA [Mixta theicola]PNS11264.1 N-acetylglucosamine-binding protein GbpA [Mixta theicola]GLR07463.1 acetylglucosamine-binding protein [Mixta theicola]